MYYMPDEEEREAMSTILNQLSVIADKLAISTSRTAQYGSTVLSQVGREGTAQVA